MKKNLMLAAILAFGAVAAPIVSVDNDSVAPLMAPQGVMGVKPNPALVAIQAAEARGVSVTITAAAAAGGSLPPPALMESIGAGRYNWDGNHLTPVRTAAGRPTTNGKANGKRNADDFLAAGLTVLGADGSIPTVQGDGNALAPLSEALREAVKAHGPGVPTLVIGKDGTVAFGRLSGYRGGGLGKTYDSPEEAAHMAGLVAEHFTPKAAPKAKK